MKLIHTYDSATVFHEPMLQLLLNKECKGCYSIRCSVSLPLLSAKGQQLTTTEIKHKLYLHKTTNTQRLLCFSNTK